MCHICIQRNLQTFIYPHENYPVCALSFHDFFIHPLWGCSQLCEGPEDAVPNILFVLYSHYWWWGREIFCSGHGDGKRGCYRHAYSFLNISVFLSILLRYIVNQVRMIVNTCILVQYKVKGVDVIRHFNNHCKLQKITIIYMFLKCDLKIVNKY